MAKLIVIRLKGQAGIPPDVKYTLKLLRLHKKFHATIVDDTPSIKGMLHKIKDYVTWGEIDKETLTELIKYRGRLSGNRKVTEEYVKKLGFNSIEDLAEAILAGKLKVKDVMKPVFRLHPPKGGFKYTIKRQYGNFGEAGYRGEAINELVKRMI